MEKEFPVVMPRVQSTNVWLSNRLTEPSPVDSAHHVAHGTAQARHYREG